jgi:hypothetical protein
MGTLHAINPHPELTDTPTMCWQEGRSKNGSGQPALVLGNVNDALLDELVVEGTSFLAEAFIGLPSEDSNNRFLSNVQCKVCRHSF